MAEHKNIEEVLKAMGTENIPEDVERIAEQTSKSFTRALQLLTSERSRGRIAAAWLVDSFRKFAVGALATTACLLLLYFATTGTEQIVWADVVDSFKSVSSFNASVYFREDATSEPKQIELWMGTGGRARLRVGEQVLFAQDGQVTVGFDVGNKRKLTEDEYDLRAEQLIKMWGVSREFSLDTVVSIFKGGSLEDTTPVVNSNAAISEDLVVFDIESNISPEWLRIWALRESRLPVRIMSWDPRDGDCVDAVFTFAREQSDDFFDPEAYLKVLIQTKETNRANIAYALLNDPGGRAYVPADLFQDNGYHMPVVEQVGITPKGAVWVVAGNSGNRKPGGRSFFGFRKLQDDLGRKYQRGAATHRTMEDRSVEVFMPEDYPFDKRVPQKLTLVCEVEEYDRRVKPELIGTEAITEWQQDAIWPADRLDDDEADMMLQAASGYCGRKEFDKCERIIEMLYMGETDQGLEHEIAGLRLSMLMKHGDYEKAAELARELWHREIDIYRNPRGWAPNPQRFKSIIVAIAAADNIDEASELWAEVRSTRPDMSKYSKGARKQILEDLARELHYAERDIAERLANTLFDLEKINKVVGCDVMEDGDIKRSITTIIPEDPAARERLKELSQYYEKHSLPQTIHFFERNGDEKLRLGVDRLPAHREYRVEAINWPISTEAGNLRIFDKIQPWDVVPLRLEADVEDKDLRLDIVYPVGMSYEERVGLLLDHYGLELVKEVGEQRMMLVARYNGRELKDYQEVPAPVRNNEESELSVGAPVLWSDNGITFTALLTSLAQHQNKGIEVNDDKVVFVDETGIEKAVSDRGYYFPGAEGMKLARQWFEEQFGITFTEELRPMKIYVLRNKQN